MTSDRAQFRPHALLLLGTRCPHCPQVLAALSEMIKLGELGQLTIINIEQEPEQALRLGVRSVPWVRIGDIELTGLRSVQEFRQWATAAGTTEGMVLHLNELLTSGQLPAAIQLVKDKPGYLDGVMAILGNKDAKINVRVGIGVIMEELQGSDELCGYLQSLGELTLHEAAPVRSDAAHYLSLTGSADAIPWLEALFEDESEEVREIAEDGLEELRNH